MLPPRTGEAPPTAEHVRIAEADGKIAAWRRFGPYVAERAWGTVREDYTASGDAWDNLTHDEARSTAYRWNEDGMAGLCDEEQYLCLGLALWNGVDPILKERMFGLTNSEGNHGEDVKEQWWYVDATPTASWLSWRYHYPRTAFPYDDLVSTNEERGRLVPEYEIADTGVMDGCWQVTLDVAKAAPDDLRLRYTVTNTGTEEATIHLLPQAWFRNTWSWVENHRKPTMVLTENGEIAIHHSVLGPMTLSSSGSPTALFCDNETNTAKRFAESGPAYPKDGINDHVVSGAASVNPGDCGTKAAFWHVLTVPAGGSAEVRIRLAPATAVDSAALTTGFDTVHAQRRAEADDFYANVLARLGPEHVPVARQAFAGLLWGKCFYHYTIALWLDGDPAQVKPPPGRGAIRNGSWRHLDNRDVISMPDPWEYPWYAAWDLAFHAVALAHVDPAFAKSQLILLCREWYMHPSGQLPAYEWNFSDVNPPVHAWAALRVFEIDGSRDFDFLERIFHKLMINFTWWVNRVDAEGNNVFEGGFLGLDNVGPFDRSKQPPVAGYLEQTDGTAWMAMYCLDLLDIALTLAAQDRTYEDVATKFFEHFTLIATAMNGMSGEGDAGDKGLWDDTDGFYYDVLHRSDGLTLPMRVRSVVGLVPIAAVSVIDDALLVRLPEFTSRLHWFLDHKPDVAAQVARVHTIGSGQQHLFSVLSPERLVRVLEAVLDEAEFLSPYGIRSLSKRHAVPYLADLGGGVLADPVNYEPGESTTGLFGGNSNWRGPIWFPLNRLVIGGIERFGRYTGTDLTVELPRGSGTQVTLSEAAAELSRRLVAMFVPTSPGAQPPAAGNDVWPEGLLWFHEYFHGETGKGLGASHQTGWTSLVVDLLLHQAHLEPGNA